jgi:ubiquinone/menaquinone biosynthesis C-methylase UbiE
MRMLDYGCGAGSYVLPAAEMVGEAGKVYALDMHPLAIDSLRKLSARKGLANVTAILSDCNTGLGEAEVDVVLLYDVLHDIRDPTSLLRELHRVLKPEGVLSVSDHHFKHEEIVCALTGDGLFRLERRNKRTYAFCPIRAAPSDSA